MSLSAPASRDPVVSGLVSVVIPCYNQGRYLAEALRSVEAQSGVSVEIVVVDDGSADETSRVAAEFSGVRLIRQENSGTAAARNRGLRESRGSYLLFLDADDRLVPGAIAASVSRLERDPECGFVWGRVRVVGADGKLIREPADGPEPREDPYIALLRHNYIWSPGAVLYRRAAVESVGGFRAFARGSADTDLNLRLAAEWRIGSVDRIVLEYRDHGMSQSANAGLMLRSSVSVRRRHVTLIRGKPEHERALRAGMREQREHYGKRVVSQLASDLRGLRVGRVLRALVALALYDPARLARWRRGAS